MTAPCSHGLDRPPELGQRIERAQTHEASGGLYAEVVRKTGLAGRAGIRLLASGGRRWTLSVEVGLGLGVAQGWATSSASLASCQDSARPRVAPVSTRSQSEHHSVKVGNQSLTHPHIDVIVLHSVQRCAGRSPSLY